MFTAGRGRLVALGAVVVGAALALSGCATSNPLATGAAAAGATLVVGSQAYYSNEIVAEIYSQALETGGFKVDRQFKIGQREVYLPEIEAGKIDVFPEYIGSLTRRIYKGHNKAAAGGSRRRLQGPDLGASEGPARAQAGRGRRPELVDRDRGLRQEVEAHRHRVAQERDRSDHRRRQRRTRDATVRAERAQVEVRHRHGRLQRGGRTAAGRSR